MSLPHTTRLLCDIIVRLVARNPQWKTDVENDSGLGSDCSVNFKLVENRVRFLMESGREGVEDALSLMRVINCFDGWKKKAGVLRRGLAREFGVAGGNEVDQVSKDGFYMVFRPVGVAETAAGVLIRTSSVTDSESHT
jgi:hypothetical protein